MPLQRESTTEVMLKSTLNHRHKSKDSPGCCLRSPKWILCISMLVMCVGVCCLLAALLLRGYIGANVCVEPVQSSIIGEETFPHPCEYSEEAQRIELDDFLYAVYGTFYQLYNEKIYEFGKPWYVKKYYRPVNLTREGIKLKTDLALALLNELNNITIHEEAMKLSEQKVLSGVKHFLRTVFGNPFASHYYAGDYLMGPNIFCWMSFCQLWHNFNSALPYFQPDNLTDLEHLLDVMEMHKTTTLQFMENTREGVRRGMVRSKEQCEVGLNAMKRRFLTVSSTNETGILEEGFVKDWLLTEDFQKALTPAMHRQWYLEHGKTVNESLRESAVENFGKPMVKLLKFLEEEHLHHCVSSDIASGFHDLPLNYVYYDDKPLVNQPTNHTLPSGHVLNGSLSYKMILYYFTTTDVTPEEVSRLGYEKLDEFYPQVSCENCKEYAGDNYTEEEAIEIFRKKLNSQEMYYNKKPFPVNESNSEAHKRCSTEENAKNYCPERWKAMQEWVKAAQEVMSLLAPKLLNLFYFVGEKKTTPSCPVQLFLELNPSSSYHAYLEGMEDCSRSASYYLPFFLENMGPTYSEWTLNAHETRPGHHLEVQGAMENFQDECGGFISWISSQNYYTAYSEGWATYAEYPLIGADTDLYDEHIFNRYGMIKWQILAALRLVIDTGLHYNGMTRKQALEMFNKFAWEDTDFASKEITRYQSAAGQSVGYMIGQSAFIELRNYTEHKLGSKFNHKEFHYQILCRREAPLDFLRKYIYKYVECELSTEQTELCDEILRRPSPSTKEKENA